MTPGRSVMVLLGAVMLSTTAMPAAAQAYPARPVRVVVPWT